MGLWAVAVLVVDAQNIAIWNRKFSSDLIHHSAHGSQYTSLFFSNRLRKAGILGSMGSVGDALDNAVAGTLCYAADLITRPLQLAKIPVYQIRDV